MYVIIVITHAHMRGVVAWSPHCRIDPPPARRTDNAIAIMMMRLATLVLLLATSANAFLAGPPALRSHAPARHAARVEPRPFIL